jgi:hypothetical protein
VNDRPPPLNFVRRRRCAQCWGPVVLKVDDEGWEIVCPKGCEPGGHVSDDYVESRKLQDKIDAAKVLENYPELNPVTPDPRNAEQATQDLFGED